MTLRDHLNAVKRQAVAHALRECGGNVTRAAEQLGVCRELVYKYATPIEIEEAREWGKELAS